MDLFKFSLLTSNPIWFIVLRQLFLGKFFLIFQQVQSMKNQALTDKGYLGG